MKKVLGKLLMLVLVIGLLAACGNNDGDSSSVSSDGDKKVIRMATSADYEPFESIDENGEFVGFDIDLAKAIAEELGYELQITDMDFNGLIGALQSNKADMVLSGMNATEERKENVDFSIEYLPANSTFITAPDNAITSLDDLEGKTVGVQLGSIQQEGVEELKDEYNLEIKVVDKAPLLVQEILAGKIDVAYVDKDVAEGYIEAEGLVGFDDPSTSAPGYAIAFPKGSELVDDVNKVLEQFKEDGTLQQLIDKWGLGQ